MTDINQIGVEAKKALSALKSAKTSKKQGVAKFSDLIEERNDACRALLVQVRDHIQNVGAVNSHDTWEGWAKHYAMQSKANLNYIINGRKSRSDNPGCRSVKLTKDMIVSFTVYVGDGNETKVMKFRVDSLPVGDGDFHSPRAKDLKGKRFANIILEVIEEPVKQKPVDERKEYLKRFRQVKRAAKFFGGMRKEFDAQNQHGSEARYNSLRETYPDNADDHRFPWTPPMKGYCLPKTYKEFKEEREKSWVDFNTTLQEGVERGWMTSGDLDSKPTKQPNQSTQETN